MSRVRQQEKFLLRIRMNDVMFFICWHGNVLWLSLRQDLQNDLEAIEMVLSKLNSPDSTAPTTSLMEMAVGFS